MKMSLRKLNSIILAGAVILSAVSCKDDDELTAGPSLNGKLKISVPAYIAQKATVAMKQTGASHPEGAGIGYSWRVTPVMTKSDTTRLESGLDKDGNESDGSFTYTFPDTLKAYTVTCYAFAKGYSGITATAYPEIVKGGVNGSVTGIDFSSSKTETIAGQTYYITSIGGRDWLRRNVSNGNSGLPYRNCKAMNDVLGRFYNWNDAKNACPQGWELPSEEDWTALAKAAGASGEPEKYKKIEGVAAAIMADAKFNGTKMWEYWPAVGEITDAAGISMIPAGFTSLGTADPNSEENAEKSPLRPHMEFLYPGAVFQGVKEYAVFWTGDLVEGEPGMAYYRYIIADQPDLQIGKGDINTFGASVRCVRKK